MPVQASPAAPVPRKSAVSYPLSGCRPQSFLEELENAHQRLEKCGAEGPPHTQPLRIGAIEDLGEVVLRLPDRSIDVITEDRALDQVEERAGAADKQLIRR